MKHIILVVLALLVGAVGGRGAVTLEQCLDAARDNYPLIKQYDLLAATEDIELSDINKGWLPRVSAYAQGTVQNVVPSFPSALSNMLAQSGGGMRGLGKVQYKVGVDVNQTIWDGGVSRAQREITRRQTEADRASLDVDMYGIRSRVQSLYFAVLLAEAQSEQIGASLRVYDANLERLRSMLVNGTAMQSDVDMVEAQKLTLEQQLIQAQSAMNDYRVVLTHFTGLDLINAKFERPTDEMPELPVDNRPEYALFERQAQLNDARRALVQASTKPRIGLFAQGYYGYPGINYFKAMTERTPDFNIVAGVRVSWALDAFYTKKNALQRIDLAQNNVAIQRKVFSFNNSLQSTSDVDKINGLMAVMQNDARIVELRANVRKAAESQLRNGVIDATALITKINDETQAQLAASYHQILYTQSIYNLRNTLNQ